MHVPGFPADKNTPQKKVNFILDNASLQLVASGARSKKTVIYLGSLLLLVIITFSMITWWNARIHPSEQALSDFYNGINRGILGDAESFSSAFNLLIPEFKDSIKKMFPGTYPMDYGQLYAGSCVHDLINVSLMEAVKNNQKTYTVVISIPETHPENNFARLISPRSGRLAKDFWSQYPAYADVTNMVVENITQYYDFSPAGQESTNKQQELISQIEQQLKLNELFDPRLIRQISEQYNLPPKARGVVHPAHNFMHFSTLEVSWITVVLRNEQWLIRTIAPQGKIYNVTNIR